jgi:hypothetical protein
LAEEGQIGSVVEEKEYNDEDAPSLHYQTLSDPIKTSILYICCWSLFRVVNCSASAHQALIYVAPEAQVKFYMAMQMR